MIYAVIDTNVFVSAFITNNKNAATSLDYYPFTKILFFLSNKISMIYIVIFPPQIQFGQQNPQPLHHQSKSRRHRS